VMYLMQRGGSLQYQFWRLSLVNAHHVSALGLDERQLNSSGMGGAG